MIMFSQQNDESTHKNFKLSKYEFNKYSSEISAIGAFENERFKSLLYLANHGLKIHVWGNGWDKLENYHPNLIIKKEFLYGVEYAKAISASKININFLRKINRDQVTSRSIEIPACKGFMITERTKRHADFFIENKEAVFFDTDEELLEKTI
jgi:spore maturation protein CgeB